MHRTRSPIVLILALAAACAAALAEPDFFTDKPYEAARADAADADKLLLVKATAVWCGPCKHMDRTTFKDESVIRWLTENAVSVSVDVDKQPRIAQSLRVRAMPTTILFKGDQELARVVGYRAGPEFLEWLQASAAGFAEPAGLPAPDDRAAEEPVNIQDRLQQARRLVDDGQHAKATGEFLWLWNNMLEHQPSMAGVRVSFLAGNMADLAEESPAAREAFERLRDETERRLNNDDPRSFDDLRDWLVLNERVLHDREPIRKWIDRIKDRPTARATFERTRDIVDEILIEDGEWALLGSLIAEPYRSLEMARMLRDMDERRGRDLPEDMRTAQRESQDRLLRQEASRTSAALLAAGREEEARRLADGAIELSDDPKTRAEIVETALTAGQPRPWHADLLKGEANAGKHADLRRRLEAALRN